MSHPHSDLPVPGGPNTLAHPPQPVLPPTLMGVSSDDFLPGPGPWASALGRQLLLVLTLGGFLWAESRAAEHLHRIAELEASLTEAKGEISRLTERSAASSSSRCAAR